MTIERIAAGGDGVGRVDGLAVFVPRTAPGDTVQVAYRQQGRLGRGRVLQRLVSSPVRVEPVCPHYEGDACGGCQLQHLGVEAQREARRHIVQESLARLARRDIPLPPLTSGLAWGYRGRLTLALRPRGQRWVGGLHAHHDAGRVFALEQCRIAHPALVLAWHVVRAHLRGPVLPVGGALRLSLRLEAGAPGDAVAVVAVIHGGRTWPGAAAFGDAVRAASNGVDGPRISAVWWIDELGSPTWCGSGLAASAPSVDADSRPVDATGADDDFAPSTTEALAFAQVNAEVADALRAAVTAAILGFRPRRVLDAYAGSGPLSEQLALAGVEVVAIEADPAGARAARARLATYPDAIQRRVHVVCDLVERALPAPHAANLPDVVVVNPPRRGVDARVTTWLEAAPATVQGLVYISCDPATLARDLSRLGTWRLASVECFDMFPQTAHVETVCVLQRQFEPEAS